MELEQLRKIIKVLREAEQNDVVLSGKINEDFCETNYITAYKMLKCFLNDKQIEAINEYMRRKHKSLEFLSTNIKQGGIK